MTPQELTVKAKNLIEGKLKKAAEMTHAELVSMNLNLPPAYQYQSIREVQIILVKGANDALGFTVELGLLNNEEAADFWKELHNRYRQLWPEKL